MNRITPAEENVTDVSFGNGDTVERVEPHWAESEGAASTRQSGIPPWPNTATSATAPATCRKLRRLRRPARLASKELFALGLVEDVQHFDPQAQRHFCRRASMGVRRSRCLGVAIASPFLSGRPMPALLGKCVREKVTWKLKEL